MEIIKKIDENLYKQFEIFASNQDIENAKTEWFEEIAKDVEVEGFRRGKVPLAIVKIKYGKQADKESFNRFMSSVNEKIVKENNFTLARSPILDSQTKEDDGFRLLLGYDLRPNFEIIPLENIHFKHYEVQIPEAIVDLEFKKQLILGAKRTEQGPDYTAQNGDELVCSFKIKRDETILLDTEETSYLIGAESDIFGDLDQKLIGLKVGTDFHHSFVYQGSKYDMDETLVGATIDITGSIKKINQIESFLDNPEILERVLKQYHVSNVEELKERISKAIAAQYDSMVWDIEKRQVLDQLNDLYTFELPSRLVNEEFDRIWNEFEEWKKKAGENPDLNGKTEEQIREEYQQIAQRRIRLGFALTDIGQKYDVTVSEDEIKNILLDTISRLPKDQADHLIQYYTKHPEALDHLHATQFENKIINFIFNYNEAEKTRISPAECKKLQKELDA